MMPESDVMIHYSFSKSLCHIADPSPLFYHIAGVHEASKQLCRVLVYRKLVFKKEMERKEKAEYRKKKG